MQKVKPSIGCCRSCGGELSPRSIEYFGNLRVCPKCYAELTEASDYERRLAEVNRNLKVADAILLGVLTIATVAMVCVLFLLLTT